MALKIEQGFRVTGTEDYWFVSGDRSGYYSLLGPGSDPTGLTYLSCAWTDDLGPTTTVYVDDADLLTDEVLEEFAAAVKDIQAEFARRDTNANSIQNRVAQLLVGGDS